MLDNYYYYYWSSEYTKVRFFRDAEFPNALSQLIKTHQYFLKQRFFILNVKDGVSAVDRIKPLWGKVSLCAVTYFKLNLAAQSVKT